MNTQKFNIYVMCYFALFMMGFQQFLSPRIGTTKIDITCAVFILFLIPYAIRVGFRNSIYIFAIVLNCIWLSISLIFLHSDFSRIIFSCFLLTALLLLFYVSNAKISLKKCKKYIDWMLLYTVSALSVQIFTGKNRAYTTGFFDEPSFAGLVLFSAASGYLGLVLHKWCNINFVKCLVLFTLGVSTLSMHVFSFLLPLMIFVIYHLLKGRRVGIWLCALLLLLLWRPLVADLINVAHYADRLNFSNPSNLSLLSWLRGLDQATYVIKNSFIFGFGPGSTGEFDFPSKYTDLLALQNHKDLNLADAYSGFFRLTIEIGFVLVLLVASVAIMIFLSSFDGNNNYLCDERVFVVWFAFTLFIGVLIKEPTYSRSYVFVAVFLLGQCRKI